MKTIWKFVTFVICAALIFFGCLAYFHNLQGVLNNTDYFVLGLISVTFGFLSMLGIDLWVWARKPENNLSHNDFKYNKKLEDK